MTQSANVNGATSHEFLLGLAARYPQIRGVLRVDDLPAPIRESLRAIVTDQMLERISRFSDEDVAEAEQRVFERFAPVPQYGI